MKLYLENLIPRLKEFSLSLDKQEVFIDKPWVIIDEKNNKQTYIFQRNGNLIMSLNGQVTVGKWEYISAARSLLIDRIQDKILLNQNFIDPAIMVLKMDGLKDENFILANVDLIPDLDIVNYLKELYYSKNNIKTKKLKSGGVLELKEYLDETSVINKYITEVKIEGEPVNDGKFEIEEFGRKYLIKDSFLIKTLVDYKYPTKMGDLVIEHGENLRPKKGDLVFQNNVKAPDGKYHIDFLENIIVENGVIIKMPLF